MTKPCIDRYLMILALGASTGCSVQNSLQAEPDASREDPSKEEQLEEDFELRVVSTKVPVVQGTSERVTVELVRKNGFRGAVTLVLHDLPEGAASRRAIIDEDSDSVELEIRADDDAPHSLPTEVVVSGRALDLERRVPLTVTVCGHPGDVDTSFHDERSIVSVGVSDDYAYAMALADDGKVFVVGSSAENGTDFALVRLERDGVWDTSFGTDGIVTTDFDRGGDVARAVAVQPDGKVVIAGAAANTETGLDFAIARYLPDGTPDTDFGQGGKVTTSLSSDGDSAYAVLIQADGKIVLAGEANQGADGTGLDFALVRHESDGSIDQSFGDSGHTLTPIGDGSSRDVVLALASQIIDGEERLVAVGGEGDFAVARYTADGQLDASFGIDGKLRNTLGSVIGAARAVQITEAGEIVVAGHKGHDFALARFTASGELDPTFAEGTPVVTPVSESNWDEATGLVIEANGKIVIGGWVYEGDGSSGNFALARYTSDGSLDQEFGQDGVVITQVAQPTKNDQANAVLLQPDERIPAVRILLGGSASDSNHDFAVVRYWR